MVTAELARREFPVVERDDWLPTQPGKPESPLTPRLRMDDPVFRYAELNMPFPMGVYRTDGMYIAHRYQIFEVVQDGEMREHRRDMGEASAWDVPPILHFCGGGQTVAELIDDFIDWRSFTPNLRVLEDRHELPPEEEQHRAAIESVAESHDELVERWRNRSIFGPGGFTQRGGWSWDDWKNHRAKRRGNHG